MARASRDPLPLAAGDGAAAGTEPLRTQRRDEVPRTHRVERARGPAAFGAPSAMFAPSVSARTGASCGTQAKGRERGPAGASPSGSPSKRISPLVARSSPRSVRSSVVLPTPVGPASTAIVPASMRSVRDAPSLDALAPRMRRSDRSSSGPGSHERASSTGVSAARARRRVAPEPSSMTRPRDLRTRPARARRRGAPRRSPGGADTRGRTRLRRAAASGRRVRSRETRRGKRRSPPRARRPRGPRWRCSGCRRAPGVGRRRS